MAIFGQGHPVEPTVFVIAAAPQSYAFYRELFETAALRTQMCTDIASALAGAEQGPCCVVMEIDDAAALSEFEARLKFRNLPIIVIHPMLDVAAAVQAMRCGAWDFLVKPVARDVLMAHVREALEVDGRRFRFFQRRRLWAQRLDGLTPRERQVMQLVVSGNANKDIAARIGVSVKTVEVHRARVMKKMQAGSLAVLVAAGIQLGMVGDS